MQWSSPTWIVAFKSNDCRKKSRPEILEKYYRWSNAAGNQPSCRMLFLDFTTTASSDWLIDLRSIVTLWHLRHWNCFYDLRQPKWRSRETWNYHGEWLRVLLFWHHGGNAWDKENRPIFKTIICYWRRFGICFKITSWPWQSAHQRYNMFYRSWSQILYRRGGSMAAVMSRHVFERFLDTGWRSCQNSSADWLNSAAINLSW